MQSGKVVYEVSYGGAWVDISKRLMDAFLREDGADLKKSHKVLLRGATVSTQRGMTFRTKPVAS